MTTTMRMPKTKDSDPDLRVKQFAETIAGALTRLDRVDRPAARALSRAAEQVADDIRAGKL